MHPDTVATNCTSLLENNIHFGIPELYYVLVSQTATQKEEYGEIGSTLQALSAIEIQFHDLNLILSNALFP